MSEQATTNNSESLPACAECGSTVWYYGHQTTVFYLVTAFKPTEDGEDGEQGVTFDPQSEEETDCAWRDVQCENGHSFEEWDRTTDVE